MKIFTWHALICILLLATGCTGDYEIPLPNGYFLGRTQPGQFVLVGPDSHSVIIPNVSAFCVEGHLVVGQSATPHPAATGYFILDTAKREIAIDLERSEWERMLSVNGTRCKLRKPERPSIFDR